MRKSSRAAQMARRTWDALVPKDQWISIPTDWFRCYNEMESYWTLRLFFTPNWLSYLKSGLRGFARVRAWKNKTQEVIMPQHPMLSHLEVCSCLLKIYCCNQQRQATSSQEYQMLYFRWLGRESSDCLLARQGVPGGKIHSREHTQTFRSHTRRQCFPLLLLLFGMVKARLKFSPFSRGIYSE